MAGVLAKQPIRGVLSEPVTANPILMRQMAGIAANQPAKLGGPQNWQEYADLVNTNLKQNFPTDPRDPGFREAVKNMAMNFAPLGITVFHGSPHRFAPTKNNPLGEFDMSKIGTGEGAQAYGHGHYLAEAKDVAKAYRDTLSKEMFETRSGVFDPTRDLKHVNTRATFTNSLRMPDRFGSDPVQAAIDRAAKIGADNPTYALAQSDIAKLKEIQQQGGIRPMQGSVYKVDLPDDQVAKMLDWDKPLSQQPESVKAAIAKIQQELTGPFSASMNGDQMLRHIQSTLKGVGRGNEKAERLLREAGIPGIRYLDGGSRAGGKGTSNFVVFSDDIPKIIGRE